MALVGIVGGVHTKLEGVLEGPVVCLEILKKKGRGYRPHCIGRIISLSESECASKKCGGCA